MLAIIEVDHPRLHMKSLDVYLVCNKKKVKKQIQYCEQGTRRSNQICLGFTDISVVTVAESSYGEI